jgi:CRISPR-associated protein Csb2
LEEALSVTERLRKSAMAQSRDVDGNPKPVFSGHEVGRGHRHAMYLASSEDPLNHGLIDHLTIRAKGGFDEQDVMALQRLRRLWGKGGHDLELILIGLGSASDYGGDRSPRSRVLTKSRVWESVTPFVPTRHPKMVRGVEQDGIEDQLRRGCEQLLGVTPELVEPFTGPIDWRRFRRRRNEGGGNRGPDRAIGARLIFAEPVEGPIALGYGAHFGLGLFVGVR